MTSFRESWDEYFMIIACDVRTRATCPRRQVGAVLVGPDKRIRSTGYNGSDPGHPHCTDVGCLMVDNSCKRTRHAEYNAIHQSRGLHGGSILYTTDFPCYNCAKLVARSGIVQLVWMIPYWKMAEPVLSLFEYEGIVCRQYLPEWAKPDHEIQLVA